jgi:hypothetical protein
MGVFRQWKGMAKQSALFAVSGRLEFIIANGTHLNNTGGLLHR